MHLYHCILSTKTTKNIQNYQFKFIIISARIPFNLKHTDCVIIISVRIPFTRKHTNCVIIISVRMPFILKHANVLFGKSIWRQGKTNPFVPRALETCSLNSSNNRNAHLASITWSLSQGVRGEIISQECANSNYRYRVCSCALGSFTEMVTTLPLERGVYFTSTNRWNSFQFIFF